MVEEHLFNTIEKGGAADVKNSTKRQDEYQTIGNDAGFVALRAFQHIACLVCSISSD
jgi:hypothetical protein